MCFSISTRFIWRFQREFGTTQKPPTFEAPPVSMSLESMVDKASD